MSLHSPAEAGGSDMPALQHPRQRASQACIMCHSRKIKCDVLRSYPCTRCRDGKLTCTIRTSNRGKTRKQNIKRAAASANQETSALSPDDNPAKLSSVVESEENIPSNDEPSPQSRQDDENLSGAAQRLRLGVESLIDQSSKTSSEKDNLPILHLSENGALTYLLGVVASEDGAKGGNFHVQLDSLVSVPVAASYKEAFSRLDRLNSAFLASKAVFACPTLAIMDRLFDLFFKYVDPHIPILDKLETMRKYRDMSISPLLLHSILFVAAHFADEQLMNEAGWSSKREMTDCFFEKARLLADFELERNQTALVQSFVLLAHHWDNWTQDRGPRYWLSRAVNVALGMGMHRKPQALALPLNQERLWRRVLSVILTRDRLVAAAVGAPVILNDKNIDLPPPLKVDDFHEEPDDGSSDSVENRPLAPVQYALNLSILGNLLGDILNRQYSAQATPDGTSSSLYIETQLDIYDRDLPSLLQFSALQDTTIPTEQRVLPPMIRAAFLLISMFYHRPLYEKHRDSNKRHYHGERLFAAAHEVHDILVYIRDQDLLKLCPLWFVTCLFHTVGVLLAEYQESLSAVPQMHETSIPARIQTIIESLKIFEQTWHMAGWGYGLFRKALATLEEKARARSTSSESSSLPPGLPNFGIYPVKPSKDSNHAVPDDEAMDWGSSTANTWRQP